MCTQSATLPFGYHIWDIPLDDSPPDNSADSVAPILANSSFFSVNTPLDSRHSEIYIIDTPSDFDSSPIPLLYSDDTKPIYVAKRYKPAAKRVHPIPTTLPEQYRIRRRPIPDPLAGLPTLPTNPPIFVPGARYTQERKDATNLNKTGFLWPEEEKLAHETIRLQEDTFAWEETEKGHFSDEYFDPIIFPVTEHTPWQFKNIPIPPGKRDEIIRIVRDKMAAGVYEDSNSSYRSRWFAVLKKDGKSLRLVHDLQPLNAVTIQDRASPQSPETYAESFGGRACYGILDLFISFDQRILDPASRDLTTFQTPLGAKRLTCIPMGYTNAPAIMQGDMSHILRDEIPEYTNPFIDDVPVKGPPTRYQHINGTYETIPQNPGIRRFVWEHMNTMNRILQRVRNVGGTFNGKKAEICAPEVEIVGHICNIDGRIPSTTRVDAIRNWPACKTLTEVRAFLGTTGLLRIFIKDYAKHAAPLQKLTRKDAPFEWELDQQRAMDFLKNAVVNSSAVRAIDYTSLHPVILAVDSCSIAVGFALFQLGEDKKRYPSRFGSITWNDRESRYSQAKLELYGLFRALRATRLYTIGVKKLQVEVDAKYIKGMLNNPDIQPNATINRWIAAILLFDFTLIHIPATKHTGVDGLSRRPHAEEDDSEDPSNVEDWIDEACGFSMEYLNWDRLTPRKPPLSPASPFLVPRRQPLIPPRPSVSLFSVQESPSIPRSDKANRADDRLLLVEEFLRTGSRPSELPTNDRLITQFVRYASDFFILDDKLWRKRPNGRHQLVIPPSRRLSILAQTHDALGHKGIYVTKHRLLERVWWPHLDQDVVWYIRSCHECQTYQLKKIFIPPTVSTPANLFRKAYIDTMFMPTASGFKGIVHARCSLAGYAEGRPIRRETGRIIANFIFEDILCRWGALEEIVTDNGTPFVKALDYLAKKYKIHHIRISPYNSRANAVERSHRPLREVLLKTAASTQTSWPQHFPAALWAERVTIQRTTGYSPYWIAHGVEPLFPFDLAEATYPRCSPHDRRTPCDPHSAAPEATRRSSACVRPPLTSAKRVRPTLHQNAPALDRRLQLPTRRPRPRSKLSCRNRAHAQVQASVPWSNGRRSPTHRRQVVHPRRARRISVEESLRCVSIASLLPARSHLHSSRQVD
jgi:hypothetical protein